MPQRRRPGWQRLCITPENIKRVVWPHVLFYQKQHDIVESVDYNDETFVPAGNKLGKDFISGYIALRYFLIHGADPGGCRIITTSIKDDHLRVLWGEIGRFIQTARLPLERKKHPQGPLLVNDKEIKYVMADGSINPISYVRGMVSKLGEGMAGHHAKYTLAILDEASGIDDLVYDQVRTWAKRILVIGNPNPCSNFFYHAVKGGDILEGQKIAEFLNTGLTLDSEE